MHGLIFLLVLCAIGAVISGPIALIISIIALKNTNKLLQESQKQLWKEQKSQIPQPLKPPSVIEASPKFEQKPHSFEEFQTSQETEKQKTALESISKTKIELNRLSPLGTPKEQIQNKKTGLEQTIGTRWVLVAGIIAVIFAVGFFLKYAYDNNLVGPAGRVIVVVIAGLITLAIGEITRRRGYDIVAKSVTALGFAILYSAVFAACAYYELISSTYAFAFSIFITASAMLYAVSLNEIAIAFLSLLGGFLTPVIISTGKNLPVPLFIYVLILDAGALFCAYYRKWRLVDFISFIGTFFLYTGWFEKFYRPEMHEAIVMPKQMPIALIWLTIFFIVYLILPVLYNLPNKIDAKKEDAFLILSNAAIVFYYLLTMLFEDYRTALSLATLILCTIHIGMMIIVKIRCKYDLNLRLTYLGIGLFFLTITIPLYLKMYAIAIAWAIEGSVLTLIGLRYRSILTQLAGVIAVLLSFADLMHQMPMHSDSFTIIFNSPFGTWCIVVCAIIVIHILYRRTKSLTEEQHDIISQASYAAAILLLLAAVILEWYYHCKINIINHNFDKILFFKGAVIISAIFPLLLLIRPVSPRGSSCKFLAAIIALCSSLISILFLKEFYKSNFIIFSNTEFLIVLFSTIMLFANAWLLHINSKKELYTYELIMTFTLTGILVLWILMTEEIYLYLYCKNRFVLTMENWRFLAHMYISVMWALYGASLMVIGFWRKKIILRYVSLGIFGLLLLKVFILDTSKVESVYRIAAFLATGITLVAVSYLYQFLKKKGFFDTILSEKSTKQ